MHAQEPVESRSKRHCRRNRQDLRSGARPRPGLHWSYKSARWCSGHRLAAHTLPPGYRGATNNANAPTHLAALIETAVEYAHAHFAEHAADVKARKRDRTPAKPQVPPPDTVDVGATTLDSRQARPGGKPSQEPHAPIGAAIALLVQAPPPGRMGAVGQVRPAAPVLERTPSEQQARANEH